MSVLETVQLNSVNPAAAASESLVRKGRETNRSPAVRRGEHSEDPLTRVVEQQTAKIPSGAFLLLSLGAMGVSLALELRGNTRASRFVGMWPPSLLMFGLYNKIVKSLGA